MAPTAASARWKRSVRASRPDAAGGGSPLARRTPPAGTPAAPNGAPPAAARPRTQTPRAATPAPASRRPPSSEAPPALSPAAPAPPDPAEPQTDQVLALLADSAPGTDPRELARFEAWRSSEEASPGLPPAAAPPPPPPSRRLGRRADLLGDVAPAASSPSPRASGLVAALDRCRVCAARRPDPRDACERCGDPPSSDPRLPALGRRTPDLASTRGSRADEVVWAEVAREERRLRLGLTLGGIGFFVLSGLLTAGLFLPGGRSLALALVGHAVAGAFAGQAVGRRASGVLSGQVHFGLAAGLTVAIDVGLGLPLTGASLLLSGAAALAAVLLGGVAGLQAQRRAPFGLACEL